MADFNIIQDSHSPTTLRARLVACDNCRRKKV